LPPSTKTRSMSGLSTTTERWESNLYRRQPLTPVWSLGLWTITIMPSPLPVTTVIALRFGMMARISTGGFRPSSQTILFTPMLALPTI
jgi:hypothetical protein